jgi:pimeloyl-ACP methyl ester carboxylesterase
VIVFLALGARAKARLRRQFPPIGQMVDIGGYRLHMHVEGQGSPTVVFDAGAGGTGLTWELVRPAIAKVTRVVVYDRAGLGWSDPSPRPRKADIMAEELHTLLINAKILGPYILVGHSLGGPVARQFAAKYPGEVAGLVMVDSAHEQQMKRFPERLVKMVVSMMGMFTVLKLINKLGLLALNPKMIPVGDQGKLPAPALELTRAAIASSNSHLEAMIAETESVNAAATQPVKSLGNLPLTVISHGQLDANAVPASLGPEIREEYERIWQQLQAEITDLSTRGSRLVAERSGHNIIFDQPEIIIKSVLEMIEASGSQSLPGIEDADVGTNPAQNPFTPNLTEACTATPLQATNLS